MKQFYQAFFLIVNFILLLSVSVFGQDHPTDINTTGLFISAGNGPGLYLGNGGDSAAVLTVEGALINFGGRLQQEENTVLLLKQGSDSFRGSFQNLSDTAIADLAGNIILEGDLNNEGDLNHSGVITFQGNDESSLFGDLTGVNAFHTVIADKDSGEERIYVTVDADVTEQIEYRGAGCFITNNSTLYLQNPDTGSLRGFLHPGSYSTISRTVVTLGSSGGFKREVQLGYTYDFPVANSTDYNPLRLRPLVGPAISDVVIRLEPFAGASINFSKTYPSLPCAPGAIDLQYDCMLQNGVWRIDGRDDGSLVYQLYSFPHSSHFNDCLPSEPLNFRTMRSPSPGGDWSPYVDSILNEQDMCMYVTVNNAQDLEGQPIPGGIYSEFSSIGVGAGPAGGGTLPVEWLFFNVSGNGLNAVLNWGTAVEVNNKGFGIYRSLDLQEFERIGSVDGSDDPLSFSEYSFIDKDLDPGTTYYYRLKQEDLDGAYVWSDVQSFTTSGFAASLNAFPNPTNGMLTLEKSTEWSSQNEVVCFDMYGLAKSIEYMQNAKQINIDLRFIPPGSYMIKVKDKVSGEIYTKQVMKH